MITSRITKAFRLGCPALLLFLIRKPVLINSGIAKELSRGLFIVPSSITNSPIQTHSAHKVLSSVSHYLAAVGVKRNLLELRRKYSSNYNMNCITLNDGNQIPQVGLGTWLSDNEEELTQAMHWALEIGYRHFDTAWIYRNENVVGKVLKEWIDSGKVSREELYIVTKLPFCAMTPERVPKFLQQSLDNLQLDYVDLYLIHVPFGVEPLGDQPLQKDKDGKIILDLTTDHAAIWAAMETQVALGKAKSIGISNFEQSQIERLLQVAKIKPSNLQVEMHAYFQQKELRDFCSQNGISVCAYSPLGSGGIKKVFDRMGVEFTPVSILDDPVVNSVAAEVNKTPAQVLLRFLTQQGIIVIPKSINQARLKQNFDIMDFDLSSSQIEQLESIDQGSAGRVLDFAFLPGVENHPEYPKSMIK